MKRQVLLALCGLVLLGSSGVALADQRKYKFLRWRDNDPFVFCTQGIKDQDRAWRPIDPISGAWMLTPGYCPFPVTGSCPYPFTMLMAWSQNSFDSFWDYQSVCKWPHRKGDWTP